MVLERLIFRQHDKVGSKITRRQLMKIKHLYIKKSNEIRMLVHYKRN
jgi:hypothetical protein